MSYPGQVITADSWGVFPAPKGLSMAKPDVIAALRAVMDDDVAGAREILEDLFPSELNQLIAYADQLKDLADAVLRMKGAR